MTIEQAFETLEKNGFMDENSEGIQLPKIMGLKGYPKGVDLENWELGDKISISKDDNSKQEVVFGIWAGGDWQEMTYMNICVPLKNKPYIIPFNAFEYCGEGETMKIDAFKKKREKYLKDKKKSESISRRLKESEDDEFEFEDEIEPDLQEELELELQDDWAYAAEKYFPEDDYIVDVLPTFKRNLFKNKHWMGSTNSDGEVVFDWRYLGLTDFEKLSALIHEMIHAKVLFETGELKPNGKAHGPEFVKIMNDLNTRGEGKFKITTGEKIRESLFKRGDFDDYKEVGEESLARKELIEYITEISYYEPKDLIDWDLGALENLAEMLDQQKMEDSYSENPWEYN